MNKKNGQAVRQTTRCAIYTRKSTEEGLEQEFNSLDAQREAAEAYIASQQHEGWIRLEDRYDDGGFTGGNIERPALKRLMADIEAGKIDTVLVYKVDRLSRSLLDFARIMETFEKKKVSFVSVTQQFNTSSSMGRLILNVLLSFAQFERELISERTRDKMAAARRKGKWIGGKPVLGYDIDPVVTKLVVNEDEARRVRAIFDLYLEHEALLPVTQELKRRGWTLKRWTMRNGKETGGQPFNKTNLYKLLTNPIHAGKITYKDEVHPGEHPAIVPEGVFNKVQSVLAQNRVNGGARVRNRHGALLKGLLRCRPCGCGMFHTYSCKKGRRYRYYVCLKAGKSGWAECPSKSIPAQQIEEFVVGQARRIAKDPDLLKEVLAQAQQEAKDQLEQRTGERRTLQRELAQHTTAIRKLLANGVLKNGGTAQLADLQDKMHIAEQRTTEIGEELIALNRELVDEHEAFAAFNAFDPVWEALAPREQARLLHLLIEQVDYDGAQGKVSITFYPAGIKTLAEELAQNSGEAP